MTSHSARLQSLVNAAAVGTLGVLLWATLAAVIARLCERPAAPRTWLGPVSRTHLFLAAWLAFEVFGYFALSPFPAVRRVMAAQSSEHRCRSPRCCMIAALLS